tara:strand:+ start:696 stop:845 length:150 start_codon:yes stop_codon:yes gene_type:complete
LPRVVVSSIEDEKGNTVVRTIDDGGLQEMIDKREKEEKLKNSRWDREEI